MASTRSLQNVVNWAQTFVGLRPLSGVGGVAGEPALTLANNVLCFILGPPFCYRWNRSKVAAFTATLLAGSTTAYSQTYSQAVSDFGFLEKATVFDGVTEFDLEVKTSLPDSNDPGRPIQISADLDDDAGNITFKLYPVPDKAYVITPWYQKKPVLISSLASKWAPIPDETQHLYNSGFLAGVFEYIDDGRFATEYQKFIRIVLATTEGMTDTQKELFLQERLNAARQSQDASLGVQQGRSSRGV